MNIRNIVSVALLTGLGLGISALAQEDKKPTLTAMAVQKGKTDKPKAMGHIVASHKAGTIMRQKDADTTVEIVIDKAFSTFYVLTPNALQDALSEYAAEDLPRLARNCTTCVSNWLIGVVSPRDPSSVPTVQSWSARCASWILRELRR